MIVAVFCILENRVDIGFSGDARPQFSIPYEKSWTPMSIDALFLAALDGLLISPRAVSAVIVEPPLFSLTAKESIANTLLRRFKVNSIGFFSRSVSAIAGLISSNESSEPGAGLVIDNHEELVVPVYDYRELTPYIRTTSEFSLSETLDLVVSAVPVDLRKILRTHTISSADENYELAIWQGASALLKCRRVWPLLTREKYKHGSKVWDSMYNII